MILEFVSRVNKAWWLKGMSEEEGRVAFRKERLGLLVAALEVLKCCIRLPQTNVQLQPTL